MVPVRTPFVVLALTEYVTVPLPDPVAPPITVSHDAEDEAVHEQDAPVVTVTEPDVASGPDVTLFGEIAMSHVPACATSTVCPAIVSDPERGADEVFAATANVTPALPVVFGPAPDVTVIQAELLTAVQEHADGIVTETTRVPPAASKASVVEETVAVHGTAA